MKKNRVPRRQSKESNAIETANEFLMCMFIHRLTDRKFADTFAKAHNITGVPPKFYKREMNG